MSEEVTLYRIYTNSKGPHLISAQFKKEYDGYFIKLIPVDRHLHNPMARADRRWPNFFRESYHLHDWCAAFTPEMAWKIYIQKTSRDLAVYAIDMRRLKENMEKAKKNLKRAENYLDKGNQL